MIQTKYHGEIEINQRDAIQFEKGIPGFLDEKKFIILPFSNNQVYFIMQSVNNPNIAFVIASPFYFSPNYEFQLEDAVVEELGLKTDKDVQVYTILSIQEPFEKSTANLMAPIIINSANQKAKQVILNSNIYQTKHPIFQKG